MDVSEISASDLAALLNVHLGDDARQDIIVVDIRPFHRYSAGHIIGAVHANVSKLFYKKLLNGEMSVSDLLNIDSFRDMYKGVREAGGTAVIYDESSLTLTAVPQLTPLFSALRRELTHVAFLKGGYEGFRVDNKALLYKTDSPSGRALSIDVCQC